MPEGSEDEEEGDAESRGPKQTVVAEVPQEIRRKARADAEDGKPSAGLAAMFGKEVARGPQPERHEGRNGDREGEAAFFDELFESSAPRSARTPAMGITQRSEAIHEAPTSEKGRAPASDLANAPKTSPRKTRPAIRRIAEKTVDPGAAEAGD